jgi:hypothetical protein
MGSASCAPRGHTPFRAKRRRSAQIQQKICAAFLRARNHTFATPGNSCIPDTGLLWLVNDGVSWRFTATGRSSKLPAAFANPTSAGLLAALCSRGLDLTWHMRLNS